ncbi:MAG: 6-phosphogluconolactonase [Cyclobacteriaceae bacterium]
MKIIRCKDYHDLSRRAVQVILTRIGEEPDLLLCAATGNTPKSTYKMLSATAKTRNVECSQIKVVQLDEWVSLPADHESSCQFQLEKELVKPLNINELCLIDGGSSEIENEILKVNDYLKNKGPIDLCILGLGTNGHLGFNEPTHELTDECHLTPLSHESREHAMIDGVSPTPSQGITLGMKQILDSRQILLLVSGSSKREIFDQLLASEEHPSLPASFLKNHPNVICLVDQEAYPKS